MLNSEQLSKRIAAAEERRLPQQITMAYRHLLLLGEGDEGGRSSTTSTLGPRGGIGAAAQPVSSTYDIEHDHDAAQVYSVAWPLAHYLYRTTGTTVIVCPPTAPGPAHRRASQSCLHQQHQDTGAKHLGSTRHEHLVFGDPGEAQGVEALGGCDHRPAPMRAITQAAGAESHHGRHSRAPVGAGDLNS